MQLKEQAPRRRSPRCTTYYNEHREEFDRPAQVVWREIEIDIAKCPSRAEARRGPTRSSTGSARATTSPGSPGREPRPDREGRRPVGDRPRRQRQPRHQRRPGRARPGPDQRGDRGARRASTSSASSPGARPGPRPFDEVQDQIKETILAGEASKYADELLASLRAKTVVTTSSTTRTSTPAVRTGGGPPPEVTAPTLGAGPPSMQSRSRREPPTAVVQLPAPVDPLAPLISSQSGKPSGTGSARPSRRESALPSESIARSTDRAGRALRSARAG